MNSINYAYAEILDVLNNMNEIYVNKIPNNLRQFFKDNASKDYKKHIVPYKPIREQKLNKETLAILAMLNQKYWTK